MSSVLTFFPNGLRIIVIDSDEASLSDVTQKLQEFKYYTVTPCTKASSALDILNHARGTFDLLLTDVRVADMDGLSLLHHVRAKFDVPIVVMSAERNTELSVECLNSGACFYLDKPLECSVLASIWQHAVARRPNMTADMGDIELMLGRSSSCSVTGEQEASLSPAFYPMKEQEEGEEDAEADSEDDEDMGANDGVNGDERDLRLECGDARDKDDGEARKKSKARVDATADLRPSNDSREKRKSVDGKRRKMKKARVVWTNELHQLFLDAIEKLGIDKAGPRKILQIMNIPELTRAHVASHLQKFRHYLKRMAEGKESSRVRPRRPILMSRRKSVFDSTPIKTIYNFKSQMDMATFKASATLKPPYSAMADTPQSMFTTDQFSYISSNLQPPVSWNSSSTIARTYMGFLLNPQQMQLPTTTPSQHQQYYYNNQRFTNSDASLLFDNQSRVRTSVTNVLGLANMPEESVLPSVMPSYDHKIQHMVAPMHNNSLLASNGSSSDFSVNGTEGNINAMGSMIMNPLDGHHLGGNSQGMSTKVVDVPLVTSSTTDYPTTNNYVGLHLETLTGLLGFGQNSNCSTTAQNILVSHVEAATPYDSQASIIHDYGFSNQLTDKGSDYHPIMQIGTNEAMAIGHEITITTPERMKFSLGQNQASHNQQIHSRNICQPTRTTSSSITISHAKGSCVDVNLSTIYQFLTSTTPPLEDVNKEYRNKNDLAMVNDFTGVGLDLEDDITFESFTSLLFDQEDDNGALANKKTSHFTTIEGGKMPTKVHDQSMEA